jgi:predicted Zn-dependent peptidase
MTAVAAPPLAALGNGVPVLVRHRPGAEVTTVSVWLLSGSRDEPAEGLTHLLEHVLMQAELPGRGVRPVDAVEALGGEANAVTSREHLMLYARVPTEEAGTAAALLVESLMNEAFPTDVVEAERRVVLEELRLAASEPDDIVQDVFFRIAYGDHPLGRPVGGTAESVAELSVEQMLAYRAEQVHAGRVGVVVSGGWPADQAISLLEAGPLGSLPAGPAPTRPDGTPPFGAGRKDLALRGDSAAVVLGGPGVPLDDPRTAAYHVLMELVGGGNGALLVEEIRSRRGLSYDVFGHASGYRDSGVWRVALSTAPEQVDEVVELAVRLLRERLDRGWSPAEVATARRRVAGLLLLDVESSLEDALLFGVYTLIGAAPQWTLGRHLESIAAVRADDIAGCAATMLDQLAVATAGAAGRRRERGRR